MDNNKLWSRYFSNHKYPCFINEKVSGELLYCNESFMELYNDKEDWKGKKFTDVVSLSLSKVANEYPDWEMQDVFETETYNKEVEKRFFVKSAIIMSRDTIFTEIIPLDENKKEDSNFDKAITRCIEIYQQRNDAKETITAFA